MNKNKNQKVLYSYPILRMFVGKMEKLTKASVLWLNNKKYLLYFEEQYE